MSHNSETPHRPKPSGASGKTSKRAKRDDTRENREAKQPPQVRCEACGKPSDRAGGRRRRFCSDACRMSAYRARAAFNGSQVESSVALRNALKNPNDSIGYKATKRDPYPSRFDVPLDLLGGDRRGRGAAELDREMWEKILWLEACAP